MIECVHSTKSTTTRTCDVESLGAQLVTGYAFAFTTTLFVVFRIAGGSLDLMQSGQLMARVCSCGIVSDSLCWLPRNLCPLLSMMLEWPQSRVIKRGPQASMLGKE